MPKSRIVVWCVRVTSALAVAAVQSGCGGDTSGTASGGGGGSDAGAGAAGSGGTGGSTTLYGGSGGASAAGGTGAPGTGGVATCAFDAGPGVTVSGNVISYSIPLLSVGPFSGKAKLLMPGNGCWASATFDGSLPAAPDGAPNRFEAHGVFGGPENWAHIYDESSPPSDVLPTLIKFVSDTDVTYDGGFGFFRKSEIDAVYAALGLTRDPVASTLVIQTLDPMTGAPSAGSSVDVPGAQGHAIPSGTLWTSGGTTDATGVLVALNVPGKAFPGMPVQVTVVAGSGKQYFKLLAENGAVTMGWIATASM